MTYIKGPLKIGHRQRLLPVTYFGFVIDLIRALLVLGAFSMMRPSLVGNFLTACS